MSTARQIIERAYIAIGYKDPSEPLNGQDTNYALDVLNSMIDGWNTQNLYILSNNELVTTTSVSPVTIGVSQTINTPRPVSLIDTSFVRINNIDYPLTIIGDQEYNAICLKTIPSTIPIYAYYDRGSPIGKIYLYPIPSVSVEIHIFCNSQLSQFANLDTDYSLAQGYFNALFLSLAEQLTLGVNEASPMLIKQAWSARHAIKKSNVEVPLLSSGVQISGLARFYAGV